MSATVTHNPAKSASIFTSRLPIEDKKEAFCLSSPPVFPMRDYQGLKFNRATNRAIETAKTRI
ncbi:MAG: hypothetical protein OSA93_16500 [Akkermansiaceae bacterium]|jgi:hypothetical protein|nr:hypothetical protein [Akkermansiaceae bacterium]